MGLGGVWGAQLKTSDLPGPSAARERAIRALRSQSEDSKEREALKQDLRQLYASAWREDVPEEDREWAQTYRDVCTEWDKLRRRTSVGQSAYESYLQSSGGVFDGEPAPLWSKLTRRAKEAWRAFAECVEEAPRDESELAAAKAAAREYWDDLWREAPPWESDPAQVHWLAAVRAARAALATYAPP